MWSKLLTMELSLGPFRNNATLSPSPDSFLDKMWSQWISWFQPRSHRPCTKRAVMMQRCKYSHAWNYGRWMKQGRYYFSDRWTDFHILPTPVFSWPPRLNWSGNRWLHLPVRRHSSAFPVHPLPQPITSRMNEWTQYFSVEFRSFLSICRKVNFIFQYSDKKFISHFITYMLHSIHFNILDFIFLIYGFFTISNSFSSFFFNPMSPHCLHPDPCVRRCVVFVPGIVKEGPRTPPGSRGPGAPPVSRPCCCCCHPLSLVWRWGARWWVKWTHRCE